MSSASKSSARFVIAGVGNVLRTDDGVGVEAVRRLQAEHGGDPLPDTRLVEVGTDVATGLAAVGGAERVLIVDAAQGGQVPGTVYLCDLRGDEGAESGNCVCRSVHALGLAQALQLPGAVDPVPAVTVLGIETASVEYGIGLTPRVEGALGAAMRLARETVARWRRLACWVVACAGLALGAQPARAAATDGVVTFTVTTKTVAGRYAPKHVLAIWVADANTNFVKTLKRQADRRVNYLYKWNTARSGYSVVDGVSGATLNAHTTHTVTWDCRDRNGTVLEDGTYRFMVEFTEANAQGPWTTNSLPFVKGTVGFTNTPASQTAFAGMSIRFVPAAPATPDIALLGLGPDVVVLDRPATLSLTVSNRTSSPANSVGVTVTNRTAGRLVAARTLASVAAHTAVTVSDLAWDTAGLAPGVYALEAFAAPLAGETALADNVLARNITLRFAVHDVAVTAFGVPAAVFPGTPTNLTVTVRNAGDSVETVDVVVRDKTDGVVLGADRVSNLSPATTSEVSLLWNPAGASLGYHALEAQAGPVPEETDLADNTIPVVVPVASGLRTNTFIAKGSRWRYHDGGIDLTRAPWNALDYDDGFWAEGAAPLGYSDNGTHTNIATKVSWGASSSAKQPTTYFRRAFPVDDPPLSMTARIRRDDGIVVYLNGVEALRDNLPTNTITYSTWASNAVASAAQYTYFEYAPKPSLMSAGLNLAAVEVHQQSGTSSDIVLDVELTGIVPILPKVHALEVAQFAAVREAVVGDAVPLSIVMTNGGTATESFTVFIQDARTGQRVGTHTVDTLLPGDTTALEFSWSTLGTGPGQYELELYAVLNGATNRLGTTVASVSPGVVSVDAVRAASSVGGHYAVVAAHSTLLVAGVGPNLVVFDRANPLAPVALGSVRLPGTIRAVALVGTLAFAACGSSGVHVVDLADPRHPVRRSALASAGHAGGIAARGDLLFVADGRAGLRIWRVTDPVTPQLTGVVPTIGPAVAVALGDGLGLLLDARNGVQVLNMANPGAPTLLGTYRGIDAARAVASANSLAVVTDDHALLHVLSLTNSAAPVRLASLYLGGVGQSIVLNGSRGYVAAGAAGLLTVDLSVPGHPRILGTNVAPDEAAGVVAVGTSLHVAAGHGGLETYDIGLPDTPQLRASLFHGFRVRDAAIGAGIAYLAGGEAGLQIFDVGDLTAPRWLASHRAAKRADAIAVAGGLAYVGDGSGEVHLLDISDPRLPWLAGVYSSTNLAAVRRIAAWGNHAILTDGYRVEWVDATDPARPVLRGIHRPDGFVFGLSFDGQRVVVASGSQGLQVLTVNGQVLSLAARVATSSPVLDVALDDARAWVATDGGGWLLFDLTNPTAPTLVSARSEPGPAVALAVADRRLLIGDGLASARSFDVRSPLTPVASDRFGPLVNTLRVAAGSSVGLVAEDTAGATLLDLAALDRDDDGLADSWEETIVAANPADPIVSIQEVQPEDDFDGDGASNRQEYLAGTSPIDPASIFMLGIAESAAGAPVVLRWTSAAGKRYAVYKSEDLAAGFRVRASAIAATPPVNEFTDAAPGSTAYYLIAVE